MELDRDLKIKYDQWMKWDKCKESKDEIEKLKNSPAELKERLSERLKFGTAGLRSKMGAGFSQMNDLTIIQTTQGLLETCKKYEPSKGIIIGYDGRRNSSRWAKIVANIFHRSGIKVYLYSDLVPTPFVAYGVKHFGTLCGVMVTASHNPKDDNGYKVYWSNGCQIVSPLDAEISKSINDNLTPLQTSWDYDKIIDLVIDPLAEIESCYYVEQKTMLSVNPPMDVTSNFKIIHSAMHGVGTKYAKKILQIFGFNNMISVKEQEKPDSEFPTVKFPNPEEKGALDLAQVTAEKHKISVVAANDPDADRLAAAEYYKGSWKLFSGNELGTLLGWWLWMKNKSSGTPKEDMYMLSSTVSSMVLKSMAAKEGFRFIETLTGFKWMGNKSYELIMNKKKVLFAFEEAIGYMCSTNVLDKDGIGALAVLAEMSAQIYHDGSTLTDKLEEIFQMYGHHVTDNGYLRSKSFDLTKQMFEDLRNWDGKKQSYPTYCGDPKFQVVKVRDLTTGYYSYEEEHKLPFDSSNQMITFTFSNNCTMTIRASGTEPKIKYYSEIILDPTDKTRTVQDLRKELKALVDLTKKYFYQRDRFEFSD